MVVHRRLQAGHSSRRHSEGEHSEGTGQCVSSDYRLHCYHQELLVLGPAAAVGVLALAPKLQHLELLLPQLVVLVVVVPPVLLLLLLLSPPLHHLEEEEEVHLQAEVVPVAALVVAPAGVVVRQRIAPAAVDTAVPNKPGWDHNGGGAAVGDSTRYNRNQIHSSPLEGDTLHKVEP